MKITFRLIESRIGLLYWSPIHEDGTYDRDAFRTMQNMGYRPDTRSLIDPPELPGWFFYWSVSNLIFDLVTSGHEVVFLGRS